MWILRFLLFPFAILFDIITRLRNRLFDLRLKPSVSFEVPVISIGNLSVGGTGKTPMVEYVIRLLSDTKKIATLSRGYGRKTKGMRIANGSDTAETLGDEPFQLYNKFKDKIIVSVGEERAFAIPLLVDQFPYTDLILLDDAYQHRFVKPGFSVLLTDYSKPFYNDFLLPSGNLREARVGAKRADVIVVTKCPDHVSNEEMMVVEHTIRRYTQQPVFFSRIRYGSPVSFTERENTDVKKVVLLTGIANAAGLRKYVDKNFELIKHLEYKDHYAYTDVDFENAVALANKHAAAIVTTEKDKAKLETLASKHGFGNIYSLPIEVEFIKNGADFDAMLLEYLDRSSISVNP